MTNDMKFGLVDLLTVGLFLVIVLWIGLTAIRKNQSLSHYLIGGRSLSLPAFVITLFATWYGGILGIGEFGFLYGLSTWTLQGLPYYFFAAVFALLFAHRAREKGVVSIAEQLEKTFGKEVGLIAALFTAVLASPAPYILMGGMLLQWMTGIDLRFCLLISALFSLVYMAWGGFRSDVSTDIFFGLVMLIGFAVIFPFLIHKYGGYSFLRENIPAGHLTFSGGNSFQFMVVWFLIALWTFVDPSFYQKCYAAKTQRVARWGILLAIVCWFVFDVMTISAALYARAIFQQLDHPLLTFPLLANAVLPPFWKGLFYAGMMATILSTMNTSIFVSSVSLGRDFYCRWRGLPEEREASLIRWSMGVSALGAILLAMAVPSVVQLWYTLGSIVVPGLLIPMITSFFPRLQIPGRGMLWVMKAGFFTSLFCLLWGWRNQVGGADYPFAVEPMLPGLGLSALVWGVLLYGSYR